MPIFETIGLAPNFVDYEAAWQTQREVHAAVAAGQKPETVLLLEHSSVFTAGKRTEDYEKPTDGTPVINVDRGGKITWHGPGQLVGYAIMRLPQPIDVVNYVRWMEQVLIDVLARLGVKGERVEGRTGVWFETESGFEKVAAIGIRVAEKVTMHGFALNCDNSLEPFEHIIACGISDAKTTTLSRILGRDVSVKEAAILVKELMGEIPSARI